MVNAKTAYLLVAEVLVDGSFKPLPDLLPRHSLQVCGCQNTIDDAAIGVGLLIGNYKELKSQRSPGQAICGLGKSSHVEQT